MKHYEIVNLLIHRSGLICMYMSTPCHYINGFSYVVKLASRNIVRGIPPVFLCFQVKTRMYKKNPISTRRITYKKKKQGAKLVVLSPKPEALLLSRKLFYFSAIRGAHTVTRSNIFCFMNIYICDIRG
jgi:hypothetical protein